ncbi:hypothetical protein F66182_5314 [Fusarium sp. NRRL 66182]|nr:hypothetical protein F66182_5314 [Fusarium sp. NRRL 66182]
MSSPSRSNECSVKSKETAMPTLQQDIEDDWQLLTKEDIQTPDQEKMEPPMDRDTEKQSMHDEEIVMEAPPSDKKSEPADAKWEGMQPQKGGVYPHRDVKVPSYPRFTGNW